MLLTSCYSPYPLVSHEFMLAAEKLEACKNSADIRQLVKAEVGAKSAHP